MSFSSRLRLSLALSLMAGLSIPFMAPAIAQNEGLAISPKGGYASAQAQPAQPAQPAQTAQTFTDVPADYWAHDYIEGLAKFNVISGFGDGTFKPNDPVTRAQFAAILRQAFPSSQPATRQPFKDVPANYWAVEAIAAARTAGFLSGYPDNSFRPNDRILRVQALVSLANGLKYTGGSQATLSAYKDANTIPAYARPSTAAAAQANLIVNYPALDQVAPNRSASRAEVAAFVYQALVKAGRATPLAAKTPGNWQLEPVTTISAKVNQISFSKTGQRLAAIADSGANVQIWNAQTGALLRTITPDKPGSVFTKAAISRDGTQVAIVQQVSTTGDIDLSVRTVDTGELRLQKSLSVPANQLSGAHDKPNIIDLVFSPDGKQVMTHVWITAESHPNLTEPAPGTLYDRLNVLDAATGKVLQSIDFGLGDRAGLAFSPDGKFLSITRYDKPVDIWQLDKNNRFAYFATLTLPKNDGSIFNMAFTNSNLLSLVTYQPNETRLDTWNVQTKEQMGRTVLPREECIDPTGVVPSPDGTAYYSSYPNVGTCFGNIRTGAFQRTLASPFTNTSAVFSGSGDYIAVASDQDIRIFSKNF